MPKIPMKSHIRSQSIIRALLCGLTLLLPLSIEGEETCTDENCHHLDPSITVPADVVNELITTVASFDVSLANKMGMQLATVTSNSREVLDKFVLLEVSINPESRVKVDPGKALPSLKSGSWCLFLVKIQNLAGVTAPLRILSPQSTTSEAQVDDVSYKKRWLQLELPEMPDTGRSLSGSLLEYRIIRVRTEEVGKRSAILSFDVGQGTADLGFRSDVMVTFNCLAQTDQQSTSQASHVSKSVTSSKFTNAREPVSEDELRSWLENMIWYHQFSMAEIKDATGLAESEISAAIKKFEITVDKKPVRDPSLPLLVLPYPGGRHPRIGFLEGAVEPQRETKVSVFTPWDPESYVVVDVPEAIFSNLGLTYLAHTHVPTLWDLAKVKLPPLEWERLSDGSLQTERTLPNKIAFGARVLPNTDSVRMELWLRNGTDQKLSDLRVQNCAMLKMAKGFEAQTNDNKIFWGPYAACRNDAGNRWIITAWDPVQRVWGNQDCPCLHSDPQFPDCSPGETQYLRGWLSFFEGTNIYQELVRIERTNWRREKQNTKGLTAVTGVVLDKESGHPLPARVHVLGSDDQWYLAESVGGEAVTYERNKSHLPKSPEVHTSLSADPFVVYLKPGEYQFRIERGKEYLPIEQRVEVGTEPLSLEFPLSRWINLAEQGWYSGDVHVHRSLDELPIAMLAEDLNVALPLTYWVTKAELPPSSADRDEGMPDSARLVVDDTHVIQAMNTEYEIFSIGERTHHLGAVLVLNHREPFKVGGPPVGPIAEEAREQGALLDLEKHSWPWSLMLVPVMQVDLFELANNHVWQTNFGLTQWTKETIPEFMQIERDADGFTEKGWIQFGMQTYYALLNCGFRLRVSAGTASGVHPVPLGFGRVYVNLPDGFDYDAWIAGLDAGHSFVSTGPFLDVRYNGYLPGVNLDTSAQGTADVLVTGTASSQHPLDRIEIIVNGQIQETITPQNEPLALGGYESPVSANVIHSKSCWVAVRCFERHPEGRVRFAHTNPVFVDIPGKPLRPRRAEINYFIQRMEEELLSNRNVLNAAQLSEYHHALKVYRELAETAE